MKYRTASFAIAATLFATLANPLQLAAQHKKHHHRMPHHYQLVDLSSTFGGPQSYFNPAHVAFAESSSFLNSGETVTGYADTSLSDPFPNFCLWDCDVVHAFRSGSDGRLTDLGALPGGGSSVPIGISANGLIAGLSENGETDPLYAGLPQVHAVLWEQGKINDLGTLPEGGYQSYANAVNSSGQVVGAAMNTTSDMNPMSVSWLWFWITPTYQYQVRAFLWDKQEGMQDLGTLNGSTDAQAYYINERGQVVGDSYISSAPGACAGYDGYPLTTNPFLWERGKGMKSIGSLGGTCSAATDLNNQGQVVGESTVTGDLYFHAFLWDGSIHDLGGSFGGNNASANAINDHGEAVGGAYYPGETVFHAALWRHVGNITDLGTLGSDRCSYAAGINAAEQIVGSSVADCDEVFRAYLWEDGSMFDLNALIPPGSALHLQFVQNINDRGEIAGMGVDGSGNTHAFLLIPCDEHHPGVAGCDYSPVDAAAATRESPASVIQKPTTTAPRTPALYGLANRSLRPFGRRSLIFNPGQMETKDGSFSIAENGGSPENLAPEFWWDGRCAVGSNGDLTGYCDTASGRMCRVTHDPTDCRPGRPAKRPEWVQSFCLPPPPPWRIDASTTCH